MPKTFLYFTTQDKVDRQVTWFVFVPFSATVSHISTLQQQMAVAGLPVEEGLADEMQSLCAGLLNRYSHSRSPSSSSRSPVSTAENNVLVDDAFGSASPNAPPVSHDRSESESPVLHSVLSGAELEERGRERPDPTIADPAEPGRSSGMMDGTRLACVALVISLPFLHMTGISLGGGLFHSNTEKLPSGDYSRFHSGGRMLSSTSIHKTDFWSVWWPMLYCWGQVSDFLRILQRHSHLNIVGWERMKEERRR